MPTHILTHYSEPKSDPVPSRGPGRPTEEKTWHPKSQDDARLGAGGTCDTQRTQQDFSHMLPHRKPTVGILWNTTFCDSAADLTNQLQHLISVSSTEPSFEACHSQTANKCCTVDSQWLRCVIEFDSCKLILIILPRWIIWKSLLQHSLDIGMWLSIQSRRVKS